MRAFRYSNSLGTRLKARTARAKKRAGELKVHSVDSRGGPPTAGRVPERREDQRDPRRCPQLQVHRMPATPTSERHATGTRRAPQEPLRPGGAVSVPAARHLDADRLDPRSTAVRADRLDSRRRKGASLTLFACTRA